MCDATIDADARTCPSCLTDLSLFDLQGSSPDEAVDLHTGEGRSIDEILASIMEGKADQPEIFETLKSVATARASRPDAGSASRPPPPPPPPPPAEAEPVQEFLCPVCDTVVRPEDKVCPGCGAEFSEGESMEYECPVCKAAVPADAAECPNCGVRFESEGVAPPVSPGPPGPAGGAPGPPSPPSTPASLEARIAKLRSTVRDARPKMSLGDRKVIARELPKLVNDVKPLLVSAKRIGLDIEGGKRLINEAVVAGKKRDIERAVKLIADARLMLDVAFVDFIGSRIDSLVAEMDRAGGRSATVEQPLETAASRLEALEYDAAWEALQTAIQAFQSQAKEYSEARGLLASTDALVADGRSMGMAVREVEDLTERSRTAIAQRDLTGGLRYAKEANERVLQLVPDFVHEEMRTARNTLLDLKMRGYDLSRPIGVLKEASARVKSEDWNEALRFLKEFRKELEKSPRA